MQTNKLATGFMVLFGFSKNDGKHVSLVSTIFAVKITSYSAIRSKPSETAHSVVNAFYSLLLDTFKSNCTDKDFITDAWCLQSRRNLNAKRKYMFELDCTSRFVYQRITHCGDFKFCLFKLNY